MKKTAIAPSNIAFIKYWGKRDEKLRIPTNGSISMNLSGLKTTTTVEFSKDFQRDWVIINNQGATSIPKERVVQHLDRIRKLAYLDHKAKVVSINNFPVSTGLSSSASGFAALTLAATSAAGLKLKERQLSILARLGSGSACRSIPSGFVEWREGGSSESSFAVSLYLPDYWDICDIVVIVGRKEKEVETTEGQKRAFSSPFFQERLKKIDIKIKLFKEYLKERNFEKFGELIEDEALELHAIILTSKPSLLYWFPETMRIMRLVRSWRKEGLPVYFTINTGHDVHLICQKEDIDKLLKRLKTVAGIKNIIVNRSSVGTRLVSENLF